MLAQQGSATAGAHYSLLECIGQVQMHSHRTYFGSTHQQHKGSDLHHEDYEGCPLEGLRRHVVLSSGCPEHKYGIDTTFRTGPVALHPLIPLTGGSYSCSYSVLYEWYSREQGRLGFRVRSGPLPGPSRDLVLARRSAKHRNSEPKCRTPRPPPLTSVCLTST